MEDEKKELNRREFTSAAVMALLSGVAVTVTACSSSSNPTMPSDPTPPGNPGSGSSIGTVSENHGHVASIDAARINSGSGFTLDITGGGDHPHTVNITMADLTTIAAGQQVTKTSSVDQSISTGPHSHNVTFN